MYAKDSYLDTVPHEHAPSSFDAVVALLRAASRALDTLAERLAPLKRPRLADPVLEFYADAGAPEGALYVDGRLVGFVEGVNRL
jgi:hypothetical protein